MEKLIDVKVTKKKDSFVIEKTFKQTSELRWNEFINEYNALVGIIKQHDDMLKKSEKQVFEEFKKEIPKQKEVIKKGLDSLNMVEKAMKPHFKEALKLLEKKSGGRLVKKNGKKDDYFG